MRSFKIFFENIVEKLFQMFFGKWWYIFMIFEAKMETVISRGILLFCNSGLQAKNKGSSLKTKLEISVKEKKE